MDTVQGLKLGATGLAGLFAGCAFYVNAADHPARMTLDIHKNRGVERKLQQSKEISGIVNVL